ncbi:MAG TPA: hypothetical protein VGK25_08320, partial [Ignavibacteria bacterium]
MKNKTKLNYRFLTVFLLFAAGVVLSQNKQMPDVKVYYSLNQDANNPVITGQPAPIKERNPEEAELERQLGIARLSNNTEHAKQIQQQLDRLRGHVQVQMPGIYAGTSFGHIENEYDHLQTQIHSANMKSHAFAVVPAGSTISGRLFYIFIRDSQPNVDTLKLMQSTNNGVSWTTNIRLWMNGYTYNKNEMDLEVVFDGTNTWVYATAGVTSLSTNRKEIYVLRVNVTASGFVGTVLNFPGSGAGMNYYNPRITSDNSNFTSTARVMLICSMDSLAGSTHFVKQKFALCSFPFAAQLAFNYAQPNGANGFGWGGNNGTNANTYLYGDIAYYKDDGGTGENRIMTVYGNPGSGINNIYLAYVSNYSTLGATLFISEPNVNKDVKIAFNGGANNRIGMITYVKQVSGTNWDIYGLKTTNGGSTAAGWTGSAIDNATERSRTCDLIALRNTSGQFKICYSQDSANQPAAFYRSYNGSSWSQRFIYSTAKADTIFGTPRAGYILGAGDDGIGFWSNYGGLGGYCS